MKRINKYLVCLFIVFILYFLIRLIKFGFIYDYLNFSSFTEQTIEDYFKLLSEITASVFAILIVVITSDKTTKIHKNHLSS